MLEHFYPGGRDICRAFIAELSLVQREPFKSLSHCSILADSSYIRTFEKPPSAMVVLEHGQTKQWMHYRQEA